MSLLSTHSMAVVAVLLNSSLKLAAIVLVALPIARLLARRSHPLESLVWVTAAAVSVVMLAVSGAFPGCHHATAYLAGGDVHPLHGWSVLAHLWATGVVLFALLVAQQMRSLDGCWRRASTPRGRIASSIDRITASRGERRPLDVRVSNEVSTPCAWGSIRPRILIPTDARHWPDEVLESVLRHEVAHLERHDWLTALSLRIAVVALWFNPVAWWLESSVRAALERGADDRVLRSGIGNVDYAEHLLWLRGRLDGRPSVSTGLALPLWSGSRFPARVRSLLTHRPCEPADVRAVGALGTAIVAFGAVVLSPPWLEARQLAETPVAARNQDRETIVVTNRNDDSVTLIDGATFDVLATLDVGQGPHEVVGDPSGRYAYVSSYDRPDAEEDSISVSVVDIAARSIREHFHVPGRRNLHGIAISRTGARLWLSAENEGAVLELDAGTGEVTAEYRTGGQWTHVVQASADDATLYSADMARGEIAFIDRATSAVRVVPSGQGAEGMALSPDGGTLWVANREENTVAVLDAASGALVARIPTRGEFPVKVIFAPDGTEVWVTNNRGNSLAVISVQTLDVVRLVELPTQPLGIGFSTDGRRVIVSAPRLDELLVVDRASGRLERRVGVGASPDGIASLQTR